MEMIAQAGDWIMIASGLLTATMLRAAVDPRGALQSMFGASLDGPLAEIIVRNWGLLIGLVGLMLIYGGWTSSHQEPILVVAGASKLAFIGLVLSFGRRFLGPSLMVPIALDAVFVLLFAIILIAG